MTYSQTIIANYSAPSKMEEIDLSSTDYEPGEDFVIYVDDVTSGTNVKVDTANGEAITLESASAGTRLGGEVGIVCKKVYKTGTTADTLYALFSYRG